jgi:ribosomal protein L24
MEGIRVHHLPQLPRRLYIEGPSFREVQHLLTYSASTYYGRGMRLIDDVDQEWLQSDSRLPSLPRATWVKITDRGLYRNDLAFVVESMEGDVVTLAVVPRFNQNQRKRKRKGMRPSPALLDAETLAQLPFKEHFHRSGSRKFHSSGLEFLLAPATHTLKLEDNPSEEQLRPFVQSIFQCSGKSRDISWLLLDAVKSVYHRKARESWRVGDEIRVRGGEFTGWRGRLVEIDSSSQTASVSILDLETSKPIDVQIVLASLERYFEIGDVVRVVIGSEKGRKGSITSIEDEVATIVELSSEAGQFFVEASIFFSLSFSLSKYSFLVQESPGLS